MWRQGGLSRPHRIREGYGMRDEVIEQAADRGIRTIIASIPAFSAFRSRKSALRRGIDLIVTDHQLTMGRGVPKASAGCGPIPNFSSTAAIIRANRCVAPGGFSRLRKPCWKLHRHQHIPVTKIIAITTIADAVPGGKEPHLCLSTAQAGDRHCRPIASSMDRVHSPPATLASASGAPLEVGWPEWAGRGRARH